MYFVITTAVAAVNEERCDKVVDFLKTYRIPDDIEEHSSIDLPDDVAKNFYLALVAICHQTTPLNGPAVRGAIDGKLLRGWDYLRAKFLQTAADNNKMVYPNKMAKITKEDILDIVRDDDGNASISKPEERAMLLNDIGKKMKKWHNKTIQELYDSSNGLLDGDSGLYNSLSRFEAYSDPVKKKSSYFLALMKNNGFWSYKDGENLLPPVDYHEARILMRLGAVRILDDEIREKISRKDQVSQQDDIDIRSNALDALMYISKNSGVSTSRLHYFLWNLARNCCSRDAPHCYSCADTCTLPDRYAELKKKKGVDNCLLVDGCESAYSDSKLTEHNVDTHYY